MVGSDLHLPEKRLLVAVVQRAVADFFAKETHPEIAWGAGRWLFSESRQPMSLWWICEWLTEDAEGLRGEILRAIKAGKRPHKAVIFRVDRR